MSKIISNEKMSNFIFILIDGMGNYPKTIEKFWDEFNSQVVMQKEVMLKAKEILIKANNRAVPGLDKILVYKFAMEGKDTNYTSKISLMLKSLTGEEKGKPFGSVKGKEGATFLWEQ